MTVQPVVMVSDASDQSVHEVGGKALTLARLSALGLPVPPGFIVTASLLERSAALIRASVEHAVSAPSFAHATTFAVRSSAVAEDLADASFAGQYETYLDVPAGEVASAVVRCREAAMSERVSSYAEGRGFETGERRIAVLVQPMIRPLAAGVAFTANPLTGDRSETVIAAVRGLGERVVGGGAGGDEWRVVGRRAVAVLRRERAINAREAGRIARLARRVERELGEPQDIEWAIHRNGITRRLSLLQARPMTALPVEGLWKPPGAGLWSRNFRLGEWLSDPMTPLFRDWLVPVIEDGFEDAMQESIGATIPFRSASINDWYYSAPPLPNPAVVWRALVESRGRIVPVLYAGLVQVSRDPSGAESALLEKLLQRWRDVEVPSYRSAIERTADPSDGGAQSDDRAITMLGNLAGRQSWYLAILGGSAWKMEGALMAFARRHFRPLMDEGGPLQDGVQVLLRALPEMDRLPASPPVQSLDWFWRVGDPTIAPRPPRHDDLVAARTAARAACLSQLSGSPSLQRRFLGMLETTERYTVVREQQARVLPTAWPALRACVLRIGDHLVETGVLASADQVFFLTRRELSAERDLSEVASTRRRHWEHERTRPAPLTLGHEPRLVGDPIRKAVERARQDQAATAAAIIGEPASAGRASGLVRLIEDPSEAGSFLPGEILVAGTTAPAWTPLFARAAAVVTDSGTLAAHASIVAREYGIPAVVGTGNATRLLRTGQRITVDGTSGIVELEAD